MTNRDYKMSKYLKIRLALVKFKTSQQKTAFKKNMIVAEDISSKTTYVSLNKTD